MRQNFSLDLFSYKNDNNNNKRIFEDILLYVMLLFWKVFIYIYLMFSVEYLMFIFFFNILPTQNIFIYYVHSTIKLSEFLVEIVVLCTVQNTIDLMVKLLVFALIMKDSHFTFLFFLRMW